MTTRWRNWNKRDAFIQDVTAVIAPACELPCWKRLRHARSGRPREYCCKETVRRRTHDKGNGTQSVDAISPFLMFCASSVRSDQRLSVS